MIDINVPKNQSITISTNNNSSVNVAGGNNNSVGANTNADAQLAYSWAVGLGLIQGIDYSSKYYAGQSANSASEAASAVEGFEDTVTEATQQALDTLDTTKQTIIEELGDEETDIISDLNTEKASIISDIQEEGTTQVSTVTNTGTSYVTEMAALKDDAQGYADSASNSASSASASETNASNSATDASGYANSAALSATSANSSALNAAASESNANTYASNASTYASDASTSANNASTSETNAAASESNAQTYANNASASASSASTSASNAATSETNAGNSATAAATSEDNAEIWAEGTDAQVQALGGVHSAKGWAEESATGQINANWTESDPTSKAYIFNKPTKLSDFNNDSGFISGITSSDVITALGYTPYNATNPNNYITASALTGYATEQWVSNQNYVNSTTLTTTLADYQPLLVSGTNIKTLNGNSILGSGNLTLDGLPSQTGQSGKFLTTDGTDASWATVTIPSIDIDNKSITENSNDELQTVGVIDQNNTSNAIKTWTGTKAQYDAIVTKDGNTLYNIIDDSDVTFALLELLFPVGAVYFGTMSVCPLETLGVGTWQALPQDKVIQIAGTRGSVGDTLNESLPNINGKFNIAGYSDNVTSLLGGETGAFKKGTLEITDSGCNFTSNTGKRYNVLFNANNSNDTYQDNAPVQQDAYLLNGWRRIA